MLTNDKPYDVDMLKRLSLHLLLLFPQGRPQDLGGGGGKNIFFRFGNLHVAKRHAAHGEAMRIARGVRGHAPSIYFFSKITIFYIKNNYFRYTLAMGYFS